MGEPAPPTDTSSLRRTLTAIDYFTLAFGSMVGVGWIVVMDDWLRKGGPAGAALAFVLGGLLIVPVGCAYGKLTEAFPRAGSEMAYTEGLLPSPVRFLVGWMMTLVYLVVCPYEAVAVGELASRLFPALDTVPLYQVGGHTVTLPRLLLGLALVAALTAINYRGVRHSANAQNVLKCCR
jgi:amino acid transporter